MSGILVGNARALLRYWNINFLQFLFFLFFLLHLLKCLNQKVNFLQSLFEIKVISGWGKNGDCRKAEFLLEINLKNLPRKTGARLNLKIVLVSLHIDPGHC